MDTINEALMFLIDIALSTNDKKWFMRLTSPEFGSDISQSFVDEMSKLSKLYSNICKTGDVSNVINILESMDALDEKYNFPKRHTEELKELRYKTKAQEFMSYISMYGINKVKVILPDEAKKLWKDGKQIHVFLIDERSLIVLMNYKFLPDMKRKEAENTLNWNNICLLVEGDSGDGECT